MGGNKGSSTLLGGSMKELSEETDIGSSFGSMATCVHVPMNLAAKIPCHETELHVMSLIVRLGLVHAMSKYRTSYIIGIVINAMS